MRAILSTYERAFDLTVNLQKSKIFCSRNVLTTYHNNIAIILVVQVVLGTGKYLGFPSMIGRSKKSTFSFIKDRIWKKNNSWSSKSLSKVGREVLIKSMLQFIPTLSLFVMKLKEWWIPFGGVILEVKVEILIGFLGINCLCTRMMEVWVSKVYLPLI